MSCHLHESTRVVRPRRTAWKKRYNFPQKPYQNLFLLCGGAKNIIYVQKFVRDRPVTSNLSPRVRGCAGKKSWPSIPFLGKTRHDVSSSRGYRTRESQSFRSIVIRNARRFVIIPGAYFSTMGRQTPRSNENTRTIFGGEHTRVRAPMNKMRKRKYAEIYRGDYRGGARARRNRKY